MIGYPFNWKNPLYNVKEFVFLTNEMTILVTQLCQSRRFLYYYAIFLAHFCLSHLNGSAVICVNVQPVLPKSAG